MNFRSPLERLAPTLAIILTVGGCGSPEPAATTKAEPAAEPAAHESPAKSPVAEAPPSATYVTTAVCTQCHADQAEAWAGSHHDLAMQPANEDTVRGNFDDVTFTHHDATWQFSRREDRYFVQTEGADGKLTEFEILYTFGVEPLQQYLVEMPNGRMHTLTAAWDSRPADEGGDRWFSLHGDERVPPDDVLHWTGPGQKWNSMCADCHSTNFQRGYDPVSKSYDSTWSDVNVGCEACHGAGSRHIAWANQSEAARSEDDSRGLERDLSSTRSNWRLSGNQRIAGSDGTGVRGQELDSCAACHARRTAAALPGTSKSFLDAHRPALLEAGLYYPDGQILEEVYVWGSFLQSRMHAAGVTCGNCHDPHSLQLRASGDALCAQCHAPARYEATTHHHHDEESEGARCRNCHMPERVYMQNDARADHSFRVPRPDLSVKIGVPNACNGCHTDRSTDWAAEQVANWPNARQAGLPHYGEAFARARGGDPTAAQELAAIVGTAGYPVIVRATAAVELSRMDPGRTRTAVGLLVKAGDPLLRYAAARASAALPPNIRAELIVPLVTDDVTLVRAEAGRALAGLDYKGVTTTQRADIDAAIRAYIDGEKSRRDEPNADVNLGLLYLALGDVESAEKAYREAIDVGPYFLPAYVNLADLYRQTQRDEEGETLLLTALERAPDSPDVHHALGLHRVRTNEIDAAIESLARAAKLEPENVRYTYVYAVALDSVGRVDEALRVLQKGLNYSAENPTLLQTLISLSIKAGREDDARRYMERFQAVAPRPDPH